MSEASFFAIEYVFDNVGCPAYLSGEFNHKTWEWAPYEKDPDSVIINNNYVFSVADKGIKSINFDFYEAGYYCVSSRFIDICSALGVLFRAVPMKIIFHGNVETTKEYFIFLPVEHISLLDMDRSEFKVDKNLETGEPLINGIYGDCFDYSWIKNLIPLDSINNHLFRCKETLALFCSKSFKDAVLKVGLRGLNFVPVDQYRYDPWHEMP